MMNAVEIPHRARRNFCKEGMNYYDVSRKDLYVEIY
jgi:hypothetical protein